MIVANRVLDRASLDEIARESRSCFLYEEAPEHLRTLQQGIEKLLTDEAAFNPRAGYPELIRAAHSLKGGAGLAQMPELSQLAHKLEDLLLVLQLGQVPDRSEAYQLLSLSVDLISDSISLGVGGQESVELAQRLVPGAIALDRFLQNLPPAEVLSSAKQSLFPNPESEIEPPTPGYSKHLILNREYGRGNPVPTDSFLKTVLEVDLEECLQRVEGAIAADDLANDAIGIAIATLVEECTLLGQTLGLAWLTDTAARMRQWEGDSQVSVEMLALAIAQIRHLRSQTLISIPFRDSEIAAPTHLDILAPGAVERVLHPNENRYNPQESKGGETPPLLDPGIGVDGRTVTLQDAKVNSEIPEQFLKYVHLKPQTSQGVELNLRVQVSRLDRMSNAVGELLIKYERLDLYQQQLAMASVNLQTRLEDLSAISSPDSSSARSPYHPKGAGRSDRYSVTSRTSTVANPIAPHFSGTLKEFQELMVQVEETRADVDLIAREFRGTLDELRGTLDNLHRDLTESRLVPFRVVAERVARGLRSLEQQYHKSVELVVEGKETLVDMAILEQLQTPLTHLLRNAFDHGIELPLERKAQGKPQVAKITLSARVEGSQVAIALEDDGRGIDPMKVYQRALQMGLIESPQSQLRTEEILELLFTPGFSTASKVTDLSGRGVGLDIVLRQVGRLRGSIQLETAVGAGTKFTINIPLTLSILQLYICRCQQRTLAIPAANVLEVINLSNYQRKAGAIDWDNRPLPVFSLLELLPYAYHSPKAISFNQMLGMVLDVKGEQVVVAIDSLLGDRQLLVKPFDATIPVPAYVAGCTLLGTGEVVPVLLPDRFKELIVRANFGSPESRVRSPESAPLHPCSNSPLPLGEGSGVRVAPLHPCTPAPQQAILVVDDSIAVRRTLDLLLSQAGYRVVLCRDGKEALAELDRSGGGFDLVLSDIEMPHLNGFGLLEEIRGDRRFSSIPVAMLTSRDSEAHVQKARRLGATAYFTKPFQPAELLGAIALQLKLKSDALHRLSTKCEMSEPHLNKVV